MNKVGTSFAGLAYATIGLFLFFYNKRRFHTFVHIYLTKNMPNPCIQKIIQLKKKMQATIQQIN
jgi:hypothetical protein